MTTATSVFVSEPGDRDVLQVREHDVPAPGAGEVQVEVAAAAMLQGLTAHYLGTST